MNLLRSLRLSRDRNVTVANLVDELLRHNGDPEVSIEASGPFRLSELHARICRMDAFLRRTVKLKPGQPVAIYRTNNTACFHWFLAIIRAGGIAVPLNPMLSLTEVRRILANSGTEILVTDKAVFDRNILTRDALQVRTWIQADDELTTLDGFLRVPATDTGTGAPFPPTAIDPPQPSPSSIPLEPAAFPRERRFPAGPCSALARLPCWRGWCSAPKISPSSRCRGRTSWPSASRSTA